MNIARVQEVRMEINGIRDLFEHDREFQFEEIPTLVARIISLLTEIGVSAYMVDRVFSLFDFQNLFDGKRSPFMHNSGAPVFSYRIALRHNLFPLRVALEVAETLLDNIEYDSTIVPDWLLVLLCNREDLKHIYSTLASMATAYNVRDAHGLLTNSNVLLDHILDLCPDLEGKELGTKLQRIIDEKQPGTLQQFFGGLHKDFFVGLNCGRNVRNIKNAHLPKATSNDVPFIVSASFGYLVIMLLENTLANGGLLESEGK